MQMADNDADDNDAATDNDAQQCRNTDNDAADVDGDDVDNNADNNTDNNATTQTTTPLTQPQTTMQSQRRNISKVSALHVYMGVRSSPRWPGNRRGNTTISWTRGKGGHGATRGNGQ